MAKKKIDLKKEFTIEEVESGLQIVHQEYFMQVLALLSYDKSQKELTYVKVPIVTPNGGVYLLSILHVEGPKVDIQAFAEVADEKTKK